MSRKHVTFTDTFLKGAACKPREKKFILSQGDGLTVKVWPVTGTKTLVYRYHFQGRIRELHLGIYPATSLAVARVAAEDARRLVRAGIDPMDVKAAELETRRTAPTIENLVSEYLNKYAKVFKRSWQSDERVLTKELLPVLGKRKVIDVQKKDIIRLLERIVERGSPAMANQVLKIFSKMFNFAVERDILPYSPCQGVKPLSEVKSCDRVLTEGEIKILWNSLDAAAMTDVTRRALKLILVTGQRPGEVAGLQSGEIDGHWWTIPAERSKNGASHRVYLTDTALSLIGDTAGKSHIFPSPCESKCSQHINPHALSVAVSANLARPAKSDKTVTVNLLGIDKFTPHDLRRTAATFLSVLGFHDEIIDAVLNHRKKGIIRTYNRNLYDTEKQAALEAWEKHLMSIIEKEIRP